MTQYSKSEFAAIIRRKYPGTYKHMSDDKLIELWMQNFPGDKDKILKYNCDKFADKEVIKQISSDLLKWLGIVICVLCVKVLLH